MKFFFLLAFTGFLNAAPAQIIEGDQLLDLVGKSLDDPLFLKLKEQEIFYTEAWDKNLSIYIKPNSDRLIKEIELQNGQLRSGSTSVRYGFYKRTLPLQLNWQMTEEDFKTRFGEPFYHNEEMNLSEFNTTGWIVKVFFENQKPVSIAYRKRETGVNQPPPVVVTNPVLTVTPPKERHKLNWIMKIAPGSEALVNWTVLRAMILSANDLKQFAGSDSVDYIGQVYYSTNYKIDGFSRSAIKRIKRTGQWFYESFYKIEGDSNLARETFITMYNELKKTIKENTGDDFILASVAKDPISKAPVNWMAEWTLYSRYTTLPAGLPGVKIGIMVSGMKDVFKNNQMSYTFKVYIYEGKLSWDFYTWDKPL